ncbi:MAG: transposase, partial [Mangrovibacterium sp.]
KIYKELDSQLKAKGATLSPEKAIEIAKTIYTIKVETPASKLLERTLLLSQEQKYLANLFEF